MFFTDLQDGLGLLCVLNITRNCYVRLQIRLVVCDRKRLMLAQLFTGAFKY